MKKCLHVLPMDKLSGAEKMSLLICKNLKEYEPVVVCGGDNLKSIFEAEGIKTYAINFQRNGILQNAKAVSDIVNAEEIDIIHAHDNTASIVSYISKIRYRLNCKLISHIHNCYPWLKSFNKNKMIDSIFRRKYDFNITCGKLVYDFYRKHTSYINSNNTKILSNAIDISDINKRNNREKNELLQKFNIPINKKIIGFVGRISEQKGILPFVKNLNNYKDKFEDCIFLMIGSGDQDDEVKQLVEEYNMKKLFIFTGHQDNIYDFYPIIDVFFLPSLYEGLPMVLLEAMSFKKPVVSMNVGSIHEVIKDNGYLIETNNYIDFIDKLEALKNEDEKRVEFGKNSFNIIKDNFDIVKYCSDLENIYNLV